MKIPNIYNLWDAGIRITDYMSNKADRKERVMEVEKHQEGGGRFLLSRRTDRRGRISQWLCITVLLAWDGLLLYMIVHCLIEPVYGAVFVAAVSIYLGYQL